jgi:hypothetical protein
MFSALHESVSVVLLYLIKVCLYISTQIREIDAPWGEDFLTLF